MTFDPASFGLAFVILAAVIGILLLYGAYRSAAAGRYHVSLLCLGTLLMLVDPLLGILVMLAAAVIVALGIDVAMGLMSLVLVGVFATEWLEDKFELWWGWEFHWPGSDGA